MSRNLFTATAANLIKTASYTKLHIPFFQRQYVWSKDNWEELFNTFLEERTPFIGSIIVKQLQNRNNEVDVIDGQQRLTTLSILIKAFYDSLNIEDKKTAYNNILTIFYSSKSILSKEYSLRLNHSRLDRNDFENIMSFDYSLKDGCTSNEIGIIDCYNYFFNRISSLKLEDYQKFLNMFEKLTDEKFSYLVLIQLSSEADEQTIFDTLNTTGVMLTASDTIKNVIYKTLGKMYEDEDFIEPQEKLINFYVKTWENIFESESNKDYWNSTLVTGRFNRTYLEFFLYCYGVLSGIYTSYDNKINDLSSVYKAYLKKVSTSNELEEFLLRMVDYAQTFKNGFKYGVNNKYYTYKRDDVLDRLLQFLYITDTTSVYPYVIKILYDYKNDNHKMNVQLHKLEKMLVINHLTANSTKTKNYNKLVMSLISDPSKIDIELADIKNNKNYSLLKKPSNKVANMYLFWIELYKRQDQKKDINSLPYNFTLEHIMPKKWKKNWKEYPSIKHSDGTEYSMLEKADIRDEAVKSIGNMTLLKSKLNSRISNAPYSEKRSKIKEYVSLELNKDLLKNYPEWSENEISTRENELIKCIEECFLYDNIDDNDHISYTNTERIISEYENTYAEEISKFDKVDATDVTSREYFDFMSKPDIVRFLSIQEINVHKAFNRSKCREANKKEFFLNPQKRNLTQDWSMALFNQYNNSLYYLEIPANSLKSIDDDPNGLTLKPNDSNKVDLYINTGTMIERKSNIDFSKFVVKVFKV